MTPAISFPRLTLVELRKMVDTRAGFWLQLTTAVLTLAVVILFCVFGETQDLIFRDMFALAILPASILLPIIGILLVSSEWSQRTALITFTLVPKRMRVMGAKIAAGVVLGAIVVVLALVTAVLAIAIVDGAWTMGPKVFLQMCVLLVTALLSGIAFGAAFLNSAVAVVLYFALPLVFGIAGAIPFMDSVADWIDTTRTTTPMTEGVATGAEWARFWVSMGVWMALPLAIGLYRIARGEIRAS
jgi:ABC-2 type transport system permease protein